MHQKLLGTKQPSPKLDYKTNLRFCNRMEILNEVFSDVHHT